MYRKVTSIPLARAKTLGTIGFQHEGAAEARAPEVTSIIRIIRVL
jgi:hypothetical protein